MGGFGLQLAFCVLDNCHVLTRFSLEYQRLPTRIMYRLISVRENDYGDTRPLNDISPLILNCVSVQNLIIQHHAAASNLARSPMPSHPETHVPCLKLPKQMQQGAVFADWEPPCCRGCSASGNRAAAAATITDIKRQWMDLHQPRNGGYGHASSSRGSARGARTPGPSITMC